MPIDFPKRQPNAAPVPSAGLAQMLARAPSGGHSELTGAIQALGKAYDATLATTNRHMQDATITAKARLVRSARTARAQLEPALAAVAKARNAASEGRDHLQRQLDAAFDFPQFQHVMQADRIIRHCAMLTPDARMAAVVRAIETGDKVTLKALGSDPADTSGLSPDLYKAVRDRLIALDPETREAAQAAKAFDEQAAYAEMIESTVLQGVANLIDFVEADSLAAMASEAAAA